MSYVGMRSLVAAATTPNLFSDAARREAEDAAFDAEARARGYVPERTCRIFTVDWHEDDLGIWTTDCGTKYQFDYGTPFDHWTFCPNCSGRLVRE